MGVLGLVIAIGLWGLFHSLLASGRAKELTRSWFGPSAERWYRLAYNLFAVASLVPVAGLLLIRPDRGLYSVPFPWAALLWLGQAAALVMLAFGLVQTGLWSFVGLDQLGSGGEGSVRLVTTGLYRFVRHPLYFSGLVLLWLSPSMTLNRLAATAAATAYLLIGAVFEERKLRRTFGESYRRYADRTPMFIPFLKFRSSRPDRPRL
jgi:protein-S-isoprenylcysteine O-methyltransferase Ste14